MTGKGRPICPDCGLANVVFLSQSEGRPRRSTEKKWRCRKCGSTFDEPARGGPSIKGPSRGLAAQLADPSVTSVDDLESEG